jgi:hypothetical protein
MIVTNHGCDMAKYSKVVKKIPSCHRIFHDAAKYFTTSLNNIHVAKEYINNIS